MIELLSKEQIDKYEEFCNFADKYVEPHAAKWEVEGAVSKDIITRCVKEGYLGCTIPKKYYGNEWDTLTYGLFTEALAKSSTSLVGLFNVHTMVMQTILKWGTDKQKEQWLLSMCEGDILGALALTEPGAGSDLKGIKTKFTFKDNKIVINGTKRWITFGGLADVILLFGVTDEENSKSVVCLVEKDTPGLTITPIKNMLGFKGSYLAVLELDNCEVNKENLIAKPGFAFSHIAPFALDYGRVSVSLSALGILRGSLEHCCDHAFYRKTFNSRLIEQSTIKEMITKMGADYEAASHLCINACLAKDAKNPNSAEKVMLAKYFTTRAANRHSHSAVQMMGAIGCNENHPVARYYRDSKVLEIIEGSNQIHEMVLGNIYVRKYRNNNSISKSDFK